MPKLTCICGYVHNLGAIPDDGWVMVRDREYEELLELECRREELAAAQADKTALASLIEADARVTSLTSRMYECPECGRLAVEKGSAFQFFAPEPVGKANA